MSGVLLLAALFACRPAVTEEGPLAPLAFLAGHCWTTTFNEGRETDTHCYEWMHNGMQLRDRHVGPDSAVYLFASEMSQPGDAQYRMISRYLEGDEWREMWTRTFDRATGSGTLPNRTDGSVKSPNSGI